MSLVMVAEDSASIRLLLRRRLEMAGHDVIEAYDGADAIERIEEIKDGQVPDVLLLDAMLPRSSGAQVLEQFKSDLPQVPVLVVSAVPDLDGDEEWARADGYLAKPIDFTELLARVDAVTGAPPRP
jgi:DNA-binding response OmpR family regulator